MNRTFTNHHSEFEGMRPQIALKHNLFAIRKEMPRNSCYTSTNLSPETPKMKKALNSLEKR